MNIHTEESSVLARHVSTPDPESPSAGAWSISTGSDIVAFDNADAMMLLTAASGLANALVHAGDISLAIKVANAYLRMSVDLGGSPISALTHVTTPMRAFSGVCLTDAIGIRVEKQALSIAVRLIRSITASKKKSGWRSSSTATIVLIDGSTYRHAEIANARLSVLTLLGCQHVDVTRTGVTVCGHSVVEISQLRDRLEVTLERHQPAFLQTIGAATFESFFRRAA
jgi:hypothetical protein